MCADGSCKFSPLFCQANPVHALDTLQAAYDLDITSDHTINFVFNQTEPVGRLKINANTIKLDAVSIQNRRGIKKITFSPVPQNITNSTVARVSLTTIPYLQDKLQID